ncbi:MAG: acetylxylan esterase [Opitutaceae bacterium]
MPLRVIFLMFVLVSGSSSSEADPAPAITEESKIPAYTLPDPLLLQDGTPITDSAMWRAKRRGELLELFATHEYGRTPGGRPSAMRWEVTAVDRNALGGNATRKEVTIWFSSRREGPQMHLLIYQPNGVASPPPVFLGLNFMGNHTVHADPGIALGQPRIVYDVPRYRPADPQPAVKEEQRGVHAEKWQIERVIARGYATVTAWCNDLCPDRVDGPADPTSAASLFATGGTEERAADAWGALGMWAWGLSRALDYLESDRELDAKRVVVHGFSRLGKAADWAAAQDERFAMLISNESGCGGAALSKRIYGETVAIINGKFPHWFAKNFRRYNDNEAALPVDQHELLALIAPRPLYVASADGDQWSDPRGEFLSAKAAEPVYALFGKRGLGIAEMPPLDTPIGETIGYHNRTGKHDMTDYDWAQYLDFADRHLKR